MLITNKVNAVLDIDAIIEDFDIYRVTKESQKLDGTNILDIPSEDFRALAVQYKYGRNAFVLFKKGDVVESDFRLALQNEFKDVTVYRVTRYDLGDEEFCRANFYYEKRLLVQLLLNSLKAPRVENLSYNNLTGKLYYGDSSWRIKDKQNGGIGWISFLEISLDPGMFLNLDVRTFSKNYSYQGSRLYVIDPKTGAFRKKLKGDPEGITTYSLKSFNNRHVTKDYLNISGFKQFQQCKLGVMERFMQDAERILGKYVKLEFCEAEHGERYNITKKAKPEITKKSRGILLNRRGINIVDENKTDRSKVISSNLILEFAKYYGVDCTEGDVDVTKYNVRIIHNPEYYEKLGLNDPHNDQLNGTIVQHLMEEVDHFNDKDSASPAVNKIVQELIIKGDILDGQLSIYDWIKLGLGKNWTFVIREKIKQSFDKDRKTHVNRAGKPVYDAYKYTALTIDPNGNLEFEEFDDSSILFTQTWQEKIATAYDVFEADYRKTDCAVEGLVFSDIDNIHAIILTPEKTIPNTRALWNGLKETNKDILVNRTDLLDAIDDFAKEPELDDKEMNYLNDLREALRSCNDDIKIGDVRRLMNMRKDIAKDLNRFMHENYNIWISPELKDSDFEEEYLLDNLLDIKYYEKEDYDGRHSFNYYVGTRKDSLNASIHNACAIRKVVAQTNKIEFDELLPLMDVEFVRNDQLTVIPFPFKYLREYQKLR